MEKFCATSDVKYTAGVDLSLQSAGLTSNAFPEVLAPPATTNSHTGVSTNSVLSRTSVATNKDTKYTPHRCALRTTYGREELKTFVYDNVNLPLPLFLLSSHTHLDSKIVKVPLVVPDNQINSQKIVCAADSDDIVASTEEVAKFKVGQKVRITDEKFKGLRGNIARYQSLRRVGITINGLLMVCTVYVQSAFVEKLFLNYRI